MPVDTSYWKNVSLEMAGNVVEKMRTMKGHCDKCEHESYSPGKPIFEPPPDPCSAFVIELTPSAVLDGWEYSPEGFGYVKRCESCSVPGSRYPWAKHLDAERVRDWFRVQTSPDPIHFDKLKELTK